MVGLGLLFLQKGNKKSATAYFKKAKQEMKNLGMSKNVFYTSVFFLGLKTHIDKTPFYSLPETSL